MFKNVSRKCRQNRGFTLMEVMVVVAILAVVVLIAVPSVIKMRQNMKFAERNDYAKSIYMAAQSNLTQMRSMGELGLLEQAAKDDDATKGIPSDVNSADFYCSSSEGSSASYNLIVPSSIDSTIRNQKVIVEYNPIIGVVYSVFYYEGNDSLKSKYESGIERDNEAFLKESQIGYYSVDKIDVLNADDAFKIYQLESTITFDNTQQGIITVDVPAQYTAEGTPKNLLADDPECTRYMQSMEVKLSISGENGGSFTTTIKAKDEPGFTEKCYVIQAAGAVKTIRIKVPIDSLTDGSFSQIADNKKDSDNFNSPPAIAPGDNVTITANVTFHPSAKDDIIMIESATIAGINPMYHSLTPNPKFDTAPNAQNTEKPYILAISNGRHLQNLSYLDAEFAQNIESIVFTQQAEDPVQPENGSTEGSTSESQPADTPSPAAETETNGSGTLTLDWLETAKSYVKKANNEPVVSADFPFTPIEFKDFTYVPSILGNGVKIQNLTINGTGIDVGLFAKLNGATVKNITLDETNTISGGTNTGALAGTTEHSTIEDCTTKAVVTGSNNTVCSVGGLVGLAKATALNTCKSSATVTSGTSAGDASNKNALGGLVGSAMPVTDNNGVTKKTTFTSCQANSATTVTSAEGSLSNLGGVIGYAESATFTNCNSWAKVNGTDADPSADKISIPNNNLGGFVGASLNSEYTTTKITLDYLPQYAQDAGGFAGIIDGGKFHDLEVAFSENATGSQTVTNFAGIASHCSNVNPQNNVSPFREVDVVFETSLTNAAEHAAGAFIYTNNSSIANIRVNLTKGNLSSGSDSVAGFVIHNGTGSTINDSYVLGYVSGVEHDNVAGFVIQNSCVIERCFANVTMARGNAFVAANDSTIKNCYGWLWGRNSKDPILIPYHCSYSYFVNGKTNEMVFYEELTEKNGKKNVSEPSSNILDTKALSHPWAVDLLNAGTPKKSDGTPDKDNEPWEKGNNGYSYPELKDLGHQGASSAPVEGDYPFGLIYEETYGTDKGYLLIPLSDDAPAHPDMPELDNDKEITDTAFYLYHITDSDISGTAHSYDKFKWISLSQLYTIYELSAKDYKVDDVTFTTYYPINSNGSLYKIRTPEQFANIDKHSGSTFRLEKSMTVEKTIDSFSGTMEDSGDITITATKSLVKNLSGTLKNLTVTGLTEPMVGTVNGGTITGCEVTASIRAEGSDTVGVIAGTLASGTIGGDSSNNCKAHGTITGTGANVGGVVGKVSGGTVKNVTSDVAVTATGENVGMFVGYAEGGSFNNCKSTVSTDILPFGHVKTESITGATHWTTNPPQGDTLSLSHFEKNFNLVTTEDSPERIVATLTNCTFRYSDTDQNALMDSAIYYYKVDTKTYSMQIGTQHAVHFNKTTPKYKDVIIDKDEHVIVGTEVATDFYVGTGTEYHRLFISVTEETSNDTDSTDGINYYVFTFTDKAKLNQTIRIEEEKFDKDADISLKDTNLYKLSGSLPTSGFEGYYQIIGNDNYLTYGAPGYLSLNNSDPATLWYWDGNNAWGNKQARDDDAKIAVSFSILDGDSFPAPVKITITVPGTEAEWNNTDMHVEHFCLQSVSLNYPFEHIATAQQVFYPTT